MNGARAGEILDLDRAAGRREEYDRQCTRYCLQGSGVHLHSDDFWHSIKHGWIAPYLPESNAQNQVVIEAVAVAARTYAKGGYFVVVDGIFGLWFLGRVQSAIDVPLHYVVLRPDLKTALARAQGRDCDCLREAGPIRDLHDQFANLGILEEHAIDTTTQSVQETLNAVREVVANGTALLPDRRKETETGQ